MSPIGTVGRTETRGARVAAELGRTAVIGRDVAGEANGVAACRRRWVNGHINRIAVSCVDAMNRACPIRRRCRHARRVATLMRVIPYVPTFLILANKWGPSPILPAGMQDMAGRCVPRAARHTRQLSCIAPSWRLSAASMRIRGHLGRSSRASQFSSARGRYSRGGVTHG
jgi:hypothetical protein